MGNDSTARILTIVGTIFNGLNVVGVGGLAILLTMLILGMPLTSEAAFWLSFSLAVVWGLFIFTFIFGLAFPIMGYKNINADGKGTAAALLIVSGIVSIFISFIGGILLIIGGALVASWKPEAEEVYRPYIARQPSKVPTIPTPATLTQTPKGASFCVSCGAKLEGDERFCAICGTPIS